MAEGGGCPLDVPLVAGMHTASISGTQLEGAQAAGRLQGTGQELLCPCKALHEEV